MEIKIRYHSIDGFSAARTFKTLKGAQAFAQKWVGRFPDIGCGYAVSFDGIGKVTVSGATLVDLFPQEAPAKTLAETDWEGAEDQAPPLVRGKVNWYPNTTADPNKEVPQGDEIPF